MRLMLLPKETKRRIFVAFILLVGAVTSFGIFSHTRAQIAGIPFGGYVVRAFPCECSGNILLTVTGSNGGLFVYYPGTQAFDSHNLGLQSGMWILGLYQPGGVCLRYGGSGCYNYALPLGTVTPAVGTSPLF